MSQSTEVVEVAMPLLAEGMEQGTVLAWLKRRGEHVSAGEDLVEIETDKASTVWPSPQHGYVEPLADEGDTAAVGAPIALLHVSGDAVGSGASRGVVSEAAGGSGAIAAEPPPAGLEPESVADKPRIQASPIARRMARRQGLDLGTVSGSGRGGRILRVDVDRALSVNGGPRAVSTGRAGDAGPLAETRPLTRIETLVAQRMTEAKRVQPDFSMAIEVDAEPMLSMRDQLRGEIDPLPSVNDMIVRACALGLRLHPRVNSSLREGVLEHYPQINIGVAVGDGDSLVVPTVFDADRLSLACIGAETRRLAHAVKSGGLEPSELTSGTFTISNLGMFGITRITPVLHGGQAAILGVGSAVPRMVPGPARHGECRRIIELTLTGDHRVLYGLHAAAFLNDLKSLLEAPARLLT